MNLKYQKKTKNPRQKRGFLVNFIPPSCVTFKTDDFQRISQFLIKITD
jgi:hypothetical protein